MNSKPESLYKFYDNKSYFCFGHEGESVKYCHGKQEINSRFAELDFKECKVVVSNVDSQASSDGGIIIQVLGEISNKNEPASKYAQTFFLAKQPKGYYVLNDIFRYLKEEINNEYDEMEDFVNEEYVEEKPQVVKEAPTTTTTTTTTPSTAPAKVKNEKPEEVKPVKEVKPTTHNETYSKPQANNRNTASPAKLNNQQTNTKEKNETSRQSTTSKSNTPTPNAASAPTATSTNATPSASKIPTATTPATTAPINNTSQSKPNQVNNTNKSSTPAPQAKPQSSVQNQTATPAKTPYQEQSQQQQQPAQRPPVQPISYSSIASANKPWSKIAQSDAKPAVIVKQAPVVQQSENTRNNNNNNNNEKDLYTVFIKLSNNVFSKEEITNALKVFGDIKNVEINNPKHFCFVEFTTIEQTKKAIAKGEVIINGIKVSIEERKRTNKSYNNGRMNSNYSGRGNRQDYHENRNYSGGSRGSNDSNMGPRRGGSNNGKRSYNK